MGTTVEEIPLMHLLPLLQRIIDLSDVHKKFGLTKSQMIIFIILHYQESMTMSEAARYISSSKEQTSRTVAILCDKGLIERYENPCNRTHVHIRFTESGKEFIQQLISGYSSGVADRLSSSLTGKEIRTLTESVRTAVEILSKVK